MNRDRSEIASVHDVVDGHTRLIIELDSELDEVVVTHPIRQGERF